MQRKRACLATSGALHHHHASQPPHHVFLSTRRNTHGDANHVTTPHANACRSYEGLRKTDLELAIDEHLSENAARYQQDPRFTDYFKSRARAGGSPVKKEVLVLAESKVSRRRLPKPADEVVAE